METTAVMITWANRLGGGGAGGGGGGGAGGGGGGGGGARKGWVEVWEMGTSKSDGYLRPLKKKREGTGWRNVKKAQTHVPTWWTVTHTDYFVVLFLGNPVCVCVHVCGCECVGVCVCVCVCASRRVKQEIQESARDRDNVSTCFSCCGLLTILYSTTRHWGLHTHNHTHTQTHTHTHGPACICVHLEGKRQLPCRLHQSTLSFISYIVLLPIDWVWLSSWYLCPWLI